MQERYPVKPGMTEIPDQVGNDEKKSWYDKTVIAGVTGNLQKNRKFRMVTPSGTFYRYSKSEDLECKDYSYVT